MRGGAFVCVRAPEAGGVCLCPWGGRGMHCRTGALPDLQGLWVGGFCPESDELLDRACTPSPGLSSNCTGSVPAQQSGNSGEQGTLLRSRCMGWQP